jgi:hypothetical protein
MGFQLSLNVLASALNWLCWVFAIVTSFHPCDALEVQLCLLSYSTSRNQTQKKALPRMLGKQHLSTRQDPGQSPGFLEKNDSRLLHWMCWAYLLSRVGWGVVWGVSVGIASLFLGLGFEGFANLAGLLGGVSQKLLSHQLDNRERTHHHSPMVDSWDPTTLPIQMSLLILPRKKLRLRM